MPAVQLGWFKDGSRGQGDQWQKAREFRDAMEACHGIAESRRLRMNSENGVENYRLALQHKAQREAAQAAEKQEAEEQAVAA
jgi:hypothetical protein